MTHVLLVGNPNCGKTTLFNALTGDNQRVGNWPGVTVEKKTGFFLVNNQRIEVTDLPGIYSVTTTSDSSQDERLATQAIATLDVDIIINVVDACYLERHLYLTSQVLELAKPMIIVLTMMDIAKQRGIHIDLQALSRQLNCPVLPMQAHQHKGIPALMQQLIATPAIPNPLPLVVSEAVKNYLKGIEQQLLDQGVSSPLTNYYAHRFGEGDETCLSYFQTTNNQDVEISLADARYHSIHQIVLSVQKKNHDSSEHFTAKLDRIVLHRFWALPIFFAVMYLMFLCAIKVGGILQDVFDVATNALFVQESARILGQLHSPNWLIAFLAYGVGKGISTTLTFIPVIAVMYFFLALLESSGYMARAAFVVDRVMRMLGLPGKAFVPMIVGFGCNVPAILAARTLTSEKDRLLTILMSPFMSCSARLAIYAVFVAAFFPQGGQNIVFSLYLIGILIAVVTGLLLRNTALKGKNSPLILELPAYHRPRLGRLCRDVLLRLRQFIVRAGRLVIPVSVVLGGLNTLTIDAANGQSILSLIGQGLTPLFEPMGLHPDNWPATVGLLTGVLAKEVVVGSLNSLYAQLNHLGSVGALATSVSPSTYGMMVEHFDGQIGAYAYLLFILIYIPCISTMAMIRQEASRQWMWFSVGWSLIMAYTMAVLFYQLANFFIHPVQSLAWVFTLGAVVGLTYSLLRYRVTHLRGQYAIADS